MLGNADYGDSPRVVPEPALVQNHLPDGATGETTWIRSRNSRGPGQALASALPLRHVGLAELFKCGPPPRKSVRKHQFFRAIRVYPRSGSRLPHYLADGQLIQGRGGTRVMAPEREGSSDDS